MEECTLGYALFYCLIQSVLGGASFALLMLHSLFLALSLSRFSVELSFVFRRAQRPRPTLLFFLLLVGKAKGKKILHIGPITLFFCSSSVYLVVVVAAFTYERFGPRLFV